MQLSNALNKIYRSRLADVDLDLVLGAELADVPVRDGVRLRVLVAGDPCEVEDAPVALEYCREFAHKGEEGKFHGHHPVQHGGF